MKITRTSQLSGITRSREIDVTETQLQAWMNGMLIQKAMPNVRGSDREFIMTGITDEEWDEYMSDPDDDS